MVVLIKVHFEFYRQHSGRGPMAYIRRGVGGGAYNRRYVFFVFQVGGPINGGAHKWGIYKSEVNGRFKGWGSR